MTEKPSSKPDSPLLVEWPLDPSTMQIHLRQARQKLERYQTAVRLAQAEIERRGQVIRALTTFTYQANSLATRTGLLQLALARALETTSADFGAVVLVGWESKRLSLEAGRGLTPDLTRILTGQQYDDGAATLMPHLIAGRGILVEENAAADKGERLLLATSQATSLVSLPLQIGAQVQGALVLGMQGKRLFTPANLYFLLALGQETAIALESLRLRETTWHLAETFLSGQELATLRSEMPVLSLEPSEAALTPLQAALSNVAKKVGGTSGAIFALDKTETGVQVSLVASHNLSPVFTNTFAAFDLSEAVLPRRLITQSNLVIQDLGQSDLLASSRLLTTLHEEGGQSLVIGRFNSPDAGVWLVLITASDPTAISKPHGQKLLSAGQALLPLLADSPTVPTPSLQNMLNQSGVQDVASGDLEQLLAAMMEAEEEVQQHNADLTTLNTITAMFNQSLDLDDILSQVVEQVRATLQADAAWVYLVDDSEEDRLHLQAHSGLSDRYVWGMRQIRFGKYLEGMAAQHNQPHFVDNLQETKSSLLLEQENIQAMAVVPLAFLLDEDEGYQVIGVMGVAMRRVHSWKQREARLLTALTGQVTLAINNAQRYNDLRLELDMLANSNQLLQTINSQLIDDLGALEIKLANQKNKDTAES